MIELTISDKNCWVCGKYPTESHHAFYGTGNRKISEKLGFMCRLCNEHHRGQPKGVHGGNKELDLAIKKHFQKLYEQDHTRKEFIKLIGRNYLD